jgi:phage host-nuclease inhibitor protein Gam
MARQKVKTQPELKTPAEVDDVLAEIGALNLQIDQEQAVLETAIREAKAAHTPAIVNLSEQVKDLEKQLAEFGEAHKDEWLADKGRRSLKLPHGEIGFRRTSVLKTLPGKKYSWQFVLDVLLSVKSWAERFVRSKPQVDREAIKAAAAAAGKGKLTETHLRRMGVCVIEEDSFSYSAGVDETSERAADAAD